MDERSDTPSRDTGDTTPFTPAGLGTPAVDARGTVGGTGQQRSELEGAIGDVVKNLKEQLELPFKTVEEIEAEKKTTTKKKKAAAKKKKAVEEKPTEKTPEGKPIIDKYGEPTQAKHGKPTSTYIDKKTGNTVNVYEAQEPTYETFVYDGTQEREPAPTEGKISQEVRERRKPDKPVLKIEPWTEEQIEALEKKGKAITTAAVRRRLLEGDFTIELEVDSKDPFTQTDNEKVVKLLEGKGLTTRDKNGNAAQKYLKTNPIDGIHAILHDIVYENPTFRVPPNLSNEQKAALKEEWGQTGKVHAEKARQWIEDNLSVDLNEWMAREELRLIDAKNKELRSYSVVNDINNRNEKLIQRQLEIDNQIIEETQKADLPHEDHTKKALAIDAIVGLDISPHPSVASLLRNGDLVGAIAVLGANSPSTRVSQIAQKLAQKIGNTKVEVVENLKNDDGTPAAGLFNPKTNTISINAMDGINPHTILHEVTHALTSATLANKSHPVTKQLNKLFNDTKDLLDSAYGAQNVDEFTAEAFSNPKFQETLAGIHPGGKPISSLERFFNIIGNFVRRMLGMQTKPVDSALNQADRLIEAMLAPAPQYRGAGTLYQAPIVKIIQSLQGTAKSFQPFSEKTKREFLDSVIEFFTLKSTTPLAKKTFLKFTPMNSTSDLGMWVGLTASEKLHVAIRGLYGAQNRAEGIADNTLTQYVNWRKKTTRKKIRALNDIVYLSTTEQVNPYKARPNNKDKKVIYDEMHKRGGLVSILGEDGRTIYKALEGFYRIQGDKLQQAITNRITNLKDENGNPIPDDQKKALQKTIFDKLFEKGRVEPYFPLTRDGEYWLEYEMKVKGADGKITVEPVYKTFRTRVARKRFKAAIAKNMPEVPTPREYSNTTQAVEGLRRKGAPPTAFATQALKILTDAKVGTEVQNEFLELFLNALPESSFAKALTRRGNEGAGKLGYDKDVEAAFRQTAFNRAAQIERFAHSENISDVVEELAEQRETISQEGVLKVKYKITDPNTKKTRRVTKTFKNYADRNKFLERASKKNSNIEIDPEHLNFVLGKEDSETVDLVFDELVSRAEFAKSPPRNATERAAQEANRLAFLGTIGFNASSAIVNLSQIPLIMYPILAGRYGNRQATKAIWNATRLYGGSSFGRLGTTVLGETVKLKGFASIDNYFVDTDPKGNIDLAIRPDIINDLDPAQKKQLEELIPLVEMAVSQGQMNRSLFYDTIGTQMGGRQKNMWDWTNAVSGFMFHQVERYNRQVAMTTVYQLELDALRKNNPNAALTEAQMNEAAIEAIARSQEMNGGAFLGTAPSIAQKGLGRVAMMYKSYGLTMYATIIKTGHRAFVVDLPENLQKEGIPRGIAKTMGQTAFKQFIGMMLTSTALAGVSGLPFIGLLMKITDLFLDEDEEDSETILRHYLSESIYKGPVNYFTGMDVANRIGLGNLLFRLNPYSQNQSPEEIFAQMLGGPAYSVGSQFFKGVSMANDGNLQRGLEMMSPAAFRNIAKTFRYSAGAETAYRPGTAGDIKSMRGDVIHDDLTTGDLIFQAVGFAPTSYTLQQEMNLSTKRIDTATNKRRSKLMKKFYIALRIGDVDDANDAINNIIKYNKDHPEFPINGEYIRNSLKKHVKQSANMHNGIAISPPLRDTLLEHQSDYTHSILDVWRKKRLNRTW